MHQIKDSVESISDAIIITKILGTLPPKFRNFRQDWLIVDDSKQNLSNLTAVLMDENTSLSEFEQGVSAFFASDHTKHGTKKTTNYSGNKNKFKIQNRGVAKTKITC